MSPSKRKVVDVPGFPFKLIIRLLKMALSLLEWYAEEDNDKKKKIETDAGA